MAPVVRQNIMAAGSCGRDYSAYDRQEAESKEEIAFKVGHLQ
jgi:hypothetical protein